MRVRTRAAVAATAAAGVLVLATSAGAGAAAAPAATGPVSTPQPVFTFEPPSVGPISTDIGPTIINGKVINPGLHVLMPGVSVPMRWIALPIGSMPRR
jgi:hypothetical protein